MLPLDDRRVERFNSDIAGRPVLVKGNSQILYGGMGRLTENSVINLKNKSHSVTAEIVVPEGGANGVIIAQGGAFAGWASTSTRASPRTATTCSDCSASRCTATDAGPAGTHQVRMEFAYDGGGLAKGGTATLRRRHQGRRGAHQRHRSDDLLRRRDVRPRAPTPARRSSDDYTGGQPAFTGKVNWVQLRSATTTTIT